MPLMLAKNKTYKTAQIYITNKQATDVISRKMSISHVTMHNLTKASPFAALNTSDVPRKRKQKQKTLAIKPHLNKGWSPHRRKSTSSELRVTSRIYMRTINS